MDLSKIRNLIFPVFALLVFCWILARPIGAISLYIYSNTAAFLNQSLKTIQDTKKDAQTLLKSQEIIDELEKEKKEISIENISYKAQALKTEKLEKALGFKSSLQYKTVSAAVIGRSPDAWHEQFIINKGSKDGVQIGRGVINEQGVVGQVKKVGLHSSIVQLISNPDWRMGVKVARLDQYCILNGNYPDNPRLKFVAIDSNIQAGDEIVSSGVCTDIDICPYPENFPVGRVISVAKDPNEIDLVVEVKYYADLDQTKYVFVLK